MDNPILQKRLSGSNFHNQTPGKNRGESATDRTLKKGPGKDFAAGSAELSPAPPHFPVFSIQKACQMKLNNIAFSTWVWLENVRNWQDEPASTPTWLRSTSHPNRMSGWANLANASSLIRCQDWLEWTYLVHFEICWTSRVAKIKCFNGNEVLHHCNRNVRHEICR